MKKHFRGVSLAAMLLTASTTVTAGEGTATVGDLPGYGADAYFADEADYDQQDSPASSTDDAVAEEKSTARDSASRHVGNELAGTTANRNGSSAAGTRRVGDLQPVSYGTQLSDSSSEIAAADGEAADGMYLDASGSMPEEMSAGLHQATPGAVYEGLPDSFYEGVTGGVYEGMPGGVYGGMPGGVYEGVPGGSCDMACDSGIGKQLDRHRTGWAQAELLLWFPQARQLPALVTTAPAGLAPELGFATTDVAFGGEVGNELTPGFRIDAGRYVTDKIGIGGRFWFLGEDDENYSRAGDGSEITIGRPFFDSSIADESAILIAADTAGGDDLFNGSVVAESSLELWAAEAYGRINFFQGNGFRTDFIGGYTHFNIEDHLSVASRSIQFQAPNAGRITSYRDTFDAENQFNGGQLGFETELIRGRWMFKTLTKVHLGNMNQEVRIDGTTRVVTPPAAPEVFDAGALALDNQGTFEQDEFAFAPEANVKLAYRFRPNVLLSVGYSFIYWDNVALAGDFVNPVLDGSTLATTGPYGQPAQRFQDSSLWVQGIDLGFVLDF